MKVLFIDSVHHVLADRLEANGFECIDGTNWSREKCISVLPEMTGIVIRSRFPMDATFLSQGKKLEFIARSGAGMENIDLSYTAEHGVTCFNAPEGNRDAVGEHAFSLLLALFNKIPKGDREVRAGKWDREGNRGVELGGKTVGLIGYGNNGNAFAKKLSGFDVEVLAYDKYKTNYGNAYAREASMDEIFAKASVVSFHIPQTEETKFMADEAFFARFQHPIYLINLARGKIVDTKALLNNLHSGKILGACLDVLEFENSSFENSLQTDQFPVLNELLQQENVIFSPHVGGWTTESYFKLSNVLADKVLKHYGIS